MPVDLRDWDEEEQELYARIVYLAGSLFDEYVPAKDRRSFEVRLREWLSCPGDESDRRQLFSLLRHIYFIGQRELDVLYRKAFRADAMWWLVPTETRFDDDRFGEALGEALERTWFCPITDSMNIAHFHHVNGIRDRDMRPEWRALARFGDRDKLAAYIEKKRYEYLVLLEDFVGTGTQARDTVKWTIESFPDLRVLVCPLVVCQEGLEVLSRIVADHPHSAVRPGIVVPDRCTIGEPPKEQEPDDFPALRDLLQRLVSLVDPPGDTPAERAYGFGGVGALTVLFTNCPNNAPPALHHSDSEAWRPLFPRAIRA